MGTIQIIAICFVALCLALILLPFVKPFNKVQK
jgi:hypothetical protein